MDFLEELIDKNRQELEKLNKTLESQNEKLDEKPESQNEKYHMIANKDFDMNEPVLENGNSWYLTVAEFSPAMEQFFGKLEEALKNSVKQQMNQVLYKEDFEYDQLMASDDLALTDEKLEKYGIKQGGLRTAILAVIRSNR